MPSSPSNVRPPSGVALRVVAIAWRTGIGTAVLAVAVVAAELDRGLPVLVLGNVVLHQVHVVSGLMILSMLALAVSWVAVFDRPRRTLVPRLLVGLTTCAAVAAAPGAAFISAMFADDWTVLAPASPNGCRVVAAEYSFLSTASHRAYALPAGQHVIDTGGEPAVRWSGDDGSKPVTSGDYGLTWDGETATLSLAEDGEIVFDLSTEVPLRRYESSFAC